MLETLTADHERFLGAIRDFIDHKLSAFLHPAFLHPEFLVLLNWQHGDLEYLEFRVLLAALSNRQHGDLEHPEFRVLREALSDDFLELLVELLEALSNRQHGDLNGDLKMAKNELKVKGFFQPNANQYYRIIIQYVDYLTDGELDDTEKKDEVRRQLFENVFAANFSGDEGVEFGVIFKEPANLLDAANVRSDFFKFDEQLKTLYQLLALKRLIHARKDSPSDNCFSFEMLNTEYQKLHNKVDQFHDAVARLKGEGQVGGDAKESSQGEVLADADILPQFSVDSAVSSAQGPGEPLALRDFLNEETFFFPLEYFGDDQVRRMCCGYPLEVQPRRIPGREEWESISLLERAFHFLLGGDVVAYLKYAHCLLMDDAYDFSQFMGRYFSPRAYASPFSWGFLEEIYSFGVGLMSLCFSVLRLVPLAIVRGLLTLPLRLVRSIALRFGAQADNSDGGVCIWLCGLMEEGLDFVLYVPIDFFLFVFTFFAGLCGFVAVVVGGGISAFIMRYIANPIWVALFFDPFRAFTEFSAGQPIEVSSVNSSLPADQAASPGGNEDSPLPDLNGRADANTENEVASPGGGMD